MGMSWRFEDALRYQGPMRKHIEMNPKREQFMQDLKSEWILKILTENGQISHR